MSQSVTSFGAAFRKLRQQRGYKLKEAAGDIVSPQFLSRFERDLASISVDKFSRLLVRIGASWNDFLRCYNGDCLTHLIGTLENFKEFYDSKDFYQFAQVAKQSVEESYGDHPLMKQLITGVINVHLAILNQDVSKCKRELDALKLYLSSIDTWGDLEWFIYSFMVDECPMAMIQFRTEQAIGFLRTSRLTTLTPKGIMTIIFHGIRVLCLHRFLDVAEEMVCLLKKELKRSKYKTYVVEHLALKCYVALILVLKNRPEGLKLAKKCIKIFEVLENDLDISHLTLSKNLFFAFIEKHRDKSIPFDW